jgi:signal transduction histidine kinase/streptogramin lyase
MFFRGINSRPDRWRWAARGGLLLVLTWATIGHGERLPVRTYTVADGLLRDTVYKIKQDSRGFLWFCTAEGISRFDGYSFKNFTADDGLPERHVNDLLETRAGVIWIATDGGLARLNPKGLANSPDNPLFTSFLPGDASAKAINVLLEDDHGAVLAGTGNGLYKLDAGSGLHLVELGPSSSDPADRQINALLRDQRNNLWIGTESGGLIRIAPTGQIDRFSQTNGLPDGHITSLLENSGGRIWVGYSPRISSGLALLVPNPQPTQRVVERVFTVADGLPSGWVTSLYENNGKFWIGTTRGLCLWQGENAPSVCQTYTAKNNLCDTDLWAITDDKDGNLWTGSICGAKKWARYGFTSYGETEGTGGALVNSIFENSAGEFFASFNGEKGRQLGRFDRDSFDLIKPRFPADVTYFGWGWNQTVWQDHLGDWWFPTGHGLYRFARPARFEDLAREAPRQIAIAIKGSEVFRLFEDRRGDIWISTTGTANELWRWDRPTDTWHDLTAETGFGPTRVGLAFAEDQSGNLWIGTGGDQSALLRYRDGQFKSFTAAEGLPIGWLRDLHVDHLNRLWIANASSGLLRLDDVNGSEIHFTRYTTKEGLSSIGVKCITEDEFGRIYIGTGRGLDRLDPATGQTENFTTADGLPSSDVDVAFRDRKNDLWFGTSNGLARFVPEPVTKRGAPNTFITGLRVAGITQSVSVMGEATIPNLELGSDQKQVTVDFLGLGANLGEKLRYEYRLGDAEWIPTSERTLNFANLAAGQYQFQVRAVTADRLYSRPAVFSFRIAAPVWQRAWFIAIMLALLAMMGYAAYRFRVSRLLEVANMRTRIATDLHDDIGANLTKIAILSEVAQQQWGPVIASQGTGDGNLLRSVAQISRESVSAMGDIVWAINPKKDSLLGLTRRMRQYAEEILAQREISLTFDTPPAGPDIKLEANLRRNVYLIFKESINNIVRHAQASEVTIEFGLRDQALVLRIQDKGRGFDVAQEFDGNGLSSMKKRAEDCGGVLEIASPDGTGTTMTLRIKRRTANWLRR